MAECVLRPALREIGGNEMRALLRASDYVILTDRLGNHRRAYRHLHGLAVGERYAANALSDGHDSDLLDPHCFLFCVCGSHLKQQPNYTNDESHVINSHSAHLRWRGKAQLAKETKEVNQVDILPVGCKNLRYSVVITKMKVTYGRR